MLAALEASGESDAGFARRHGVGLHRIRYWRKRLKEAPEARFVPVRTVAPSRTVADRDVGERQVELELASGARLRFRGSWDAASIEPWLRATEVRS